MMRNERSRELDERPDDVIRYPIGRFHFEEPARDARARCIRQFREAPRLLKDAVGGLSATQLMTRYRDGGWTLAQVVHHLAEADVNAYPRLKFALTEDNPDVMVADEAAWAELPDARSSDIAHSLLLFEAIRMRWADAWDGLSETDFQRTWRHARFGQVRVDHMLQQYAWHARHHAAQIVECRNRMGW
jgi:uncharacterized damage-inducible protein DinB